MKIKHLMVINGYANSQGRVEVQDKKDNWYIIEPEELLKMVQSCKLEETITPRQKYKRLIIKKI